MILPTKHTNIEQSLLGFGSFVLNSIGDVTVSVDYLWQEYQRAFDDEEYSAKHSFDNLLLTLVFLHSINAVEEVDGELRKCN